jgi:hypothetical protein
MSAARTVYLTRAEANKLTTWYGMLVTNLDVIEEWSCAKHQEANHAQASGLSLRAAPVEILLILRLRVSDSRSVATPWQAFSEILMPTALAQLEGRCDLQDRSFLCLENRFATMFRRRAGSCKLCLPLVLVDILDCLWTSRQTCQIFYHRTHQALKNQFHRTTASLLHQYFV